MKCKKPFFIVFSLLSLALIASCKVKKESAADLVDRPNEYYFHGNLTYHPDSAFFEESITGRIIPLEMTGFSFIVETEYNQIADKIGQPIYVEIKGSLLPDPDKLIETKLSISKVLNYNLTPRTPELLVGEFKTNTKTLYLNPDHTFKKVDNSSSAVRTREGKWHLTNKETMLFIYEDDKIVKRINYKKKSLNSKKDIPEIFLLTQSNR